MKQIMKYPTLLNAEQLLPALDQYDCIIDARSPSEYAQDHLPGAINCPVLDDAQRAMVGTLDRQVNPFEARKIGAALVSQNIGLHLQQHFLDMPREWKPLVYCWRGGNRSGAFAHVLARIGWPVTQLEGGYQAYRRSVIASLDQLADHFTFRAVCGTTGSGKSRLLQVLAREGAQVLDLEQLANHRGSVLGGLPTAPQPSQKMFESRLWDTMRRLSPQQLVYVESESKKIGDVRVPDKLMDRIRESTCVRVDTSTTDRVALLIEDYPHLVTDTDLLATQLGHLVPLHGHEKINRWTQLARDGHTADMVESLLVEHYDPAYLRSIHRNYLCYGNARALALNGIADDDFSAAARALIADDAAILPSMPENLSTAEPDQ